jgi:hypothetical protein
MGTRREPERLLSSRMDGIGCCSERRVTYLSFEMTLRCEACLKRQHCADQGLDIVCGKVKRLSRTPSTQWVVVVDTGRVRWRSSAAQRNDVIFRGGKASIFRPDRFLLCRTHHNNAFSLFVSQTARGTPSLLRCLTAPPRPPSYSSGRLLQHCKTGRRKDIRTAGVPLL